jgi:hypothetical protein
MINNMTRINEAKYNLEVTSVPARSRTKALKNFRDVIQDYPHFEASLFDEQFFSSKVIPMVEAARKNGRRLQPQQVTAAWADQLHLNAVSRRERVKELTPIAKLIIADLN